MNRGSEPTIAVLMITKNEHHYLAEVARNLAGFADRVCVLDSFSDDGTPETARAFGWRVEQRRFDGFGAQWNAAMRLFAGEADWFIKIDPDERLSEEVKRAIRDAIRRPDIDGLVLTLRLRFMGALIPGRLRLLRCWRAGKAAMSEVRVNEHIHVDGRVIGVGGTIEHLDSPDLEHWVRKQNAYTSAEAAMRLSSEALAARPRLLGSALERRMFFKRLWPKIPGRYLLFYLYLLFGCGAVLGGRAGIRWATMRVWVMRMIDYKVIEAEARSGRSAP